MSDNNPQIRWRLIGTLVILPMLFLILVAVRFVGVPSARESDKEAIQQVLDGQVAAWNRGDLDGFMAGYWKAEDLRFFSGKEPTRGWQATLDRYRQKYQAEGKEMGHLTFNDIEIEVVSRDVAWVRGRWKLVTSKETPGGLFTLIFRKRSEGWRIVHDHTSG